MSTQKTMKNKDFGRLKTQVIYQNLSKCRFGGAHGRKTNANQKGKTTVQHVCSHLFRNFIPTKNQAGGKTNMENSTSNFSTNKSCFMKKTS